MKLSREKVSATNSRHLVQAGTFFVVLYWCIESALHSYFFDGGSFLSHVLYPDSHEIWMRLIVILLLVIFSLYGQSAINRLKKTELALLEREEEAHRILENNPAAIILVDCDSREISYANQNASHLIGMPRDMLIGNHCHRFLCTQEKSKCPILDMGQPRDIAEREIVTVDGKIIPVLKNVTTITYKGRKHLLETFFNITNQKKMQQELHQAHAELNQIFQTATVGMRLIDNNYNIIKINQAFTALSGVALEDSVGKKCFDVFAGNMCHTTECSLQKILHGRGLADCEVTKVRADGSLLICNLTASRFEGVNGMVGVVEAFKDITEFKRVQNELQSERDLLHRILFHQFETVGIVNDHYALEYQNELLKIDTKGRDPCYCFEVFRNSNQPCNNCVMQEAFLSKKIQRFEFDTAEGSCFQHTYTPFVDNDGRNKALISRRDITETKASIAAAINSERLAALGELAAGVAHEINNPINGIINYAQILVNKTETGNQLNEISSRIIGEGDRIAAIVASLLSFSRRENENRSLVSIQELLEESLTLTGAQLRKDGIKLTITISDDIPAICAAAQQIEQVFLNIINNSRYALNEKYPQGGEMKRLNIDIGLVKSTAGSLVRTCFTDYGTGIHPDLINKVANPFFSTKPKGQGTGLGLSISHRIVENHGGRLIMESIFGKHTKVTVEFPTT